MFSGTVCLPTFLQHYANDCSPHNDILSHGVHEYGYCGQLPVIRTNVFVSWIVMVKNSPFLPSVFCVLPSTIAKITTLFVQTHTSLLPVLLPSLPPSLHSSFNKLKWQSSVNHTALETLN